MAPLQQELSNLEVEPVQIVEQAPCREGFHTPPQESSLDHITAASGDVEAIWTGTLPVNECCCCCCPCCCA